jgi:hypothetical protein
VRPSRKSEIWISLVDIFRNVVETKKIRSGKPKGGKNNSTWQDDQSLAADYSKAKEKKKKKKKKSFESGSNRWPRDNYVIIFRYSPTLFQLSYRRHNIGCNNVTKSKIYASDAVKSLGEYCSAGGRAGEILHQCFSKRLCVTPGHTQHRRAMVTRQFFFLLASFEWLWRNSCRLVVEKGALSALRINWASVT